MKPSVESSYLLLIEDDPWLAKSYQNLLGDILPVIIVNSSSAAIHQIDQAAPSLIVADVMLEHGLVIDLLHEMQSYADTATIPIILCSGIASQLSLTELQAYGVVRLLDKATVTPDVLRNTVKEYL